MLAHDVFASFRHRLTVKPEIHSLFLPSIQNTSSFQHGLREIIILRGNSSNFSEKVLQGSWEYIGMTRPLTACHDGWEDVPNLTQGWVLIPGSDKTRVMIEIWNWNDLEHMRRIKDPMQPNRGPHDSYSSQITYLLDEALAGGVRAQVLKTQLCRAMTVASVQREESKRLKKRCCIVQ